MSKINLHNYEAYYLDYLEGNLDINDIEQLFLFLNQNPTLKSDLEDIEIIRLNANPEVTYDKEILHQYITENNVDDYIIASLEHEIEDEDATELEEYLKNSKEAKILAERYQKTILPKLLIKYPDKRQLKKNIPPVYYLMPIASAAAVALILLVINPFSSEKIAVPMALYQTKSSITDTARVALKIEEPITKDKIENVQNKNIKPTKIAISKKDKTAEKEMHKLADIQNKNSGVTDSIKNVIQQIKKPEGLQEIEIASTDNKTQVNSGNLKQSVITEKKQMPERKNLAVENTQERPENKEIAKYVKIKSKGLNLWRVVGIGLKALGKLNERDLDIERNVTASNQTKTETLDEQRKINTPSI